ncbi:nucleotidyltransferase family protein [candidate division KSB1 bacterium]|nr:nucleotidyltransferase family protein [candidate division KSB1 bacterium]
MKAMILAAGYGTRLEHLTQQKPKALIEVGGKPLLEWIIRKLIAAGFTEIIINLHHLADQIVRFIGQQHHFGIQIHFSYETTILGTGGGIKKAANFLQTEPWFLVHNVDVISALNLKPLIQAHLSAGSLATVFVDQRHSTRHLLFDAHNFLCGRHLDQDILIRPVDGVLQRLAFNGIHVISTAIFAATPPEDTFSIIDWYLQLAKAGAQIKGQCFEGVYWRDAGRRTILAEIESDLQSRCVLPEQLIFPD